MKRFTFTYLIIAGLAAAPSVWTAPAGAGELRGEFGVESRAFPSDPASAAQHGSNVSVRFKPEFFHDWDGGQQRLAMTLFARLDADDDARSHADIRELFWRKTFGGSVDIYVGVRSVFWGVTETLHLVDIINQTDLVENIDGEDKLGQPMISGAWQSNHGTVDLFIMPYFRERTFSGQGGRLRPPVVVDTDNPVYESSNGNNHVDLAVRYSNYVGDFDFGVAYFSGTSRDPRLVPTSLAPGVAVLRPHYDLVDRFSLDLQFTREDWAWKLEAAHRITGIENSTAFVAGFEYTMVSIYGHAADMGIIAEYQYDDQNAPVLGDSDIAIGGRLSLNDVNNTSLLAYTAIDTETGGTVTSIEGNRRVGNNWGIDIEARLFTSNDAGDPLHWLSDDNYIQLELVRFF
jgi:hypothetical protein